MSYFSLHNHTCYSNIKLIDSINFVEGLIDQAYNIGLKGVAITDHDCLSGHLKAISHFQKKYKDNEEDFKLVLGNEIYVSREGLVAENHEQGELFMHMILLAKDAIGHRQIRELSSRAWDRSYIRAVTRTPTYNSDLKEIIGKNKGHVVATTACLGGVIGKKFTRAQENNQAFTLEDAAKILEEYYEIFGEDFYLELQPSHQEDQVEYNKFLIQLQAYFEEKHSYRPRLIFATDSHYLHADEYDVFKHFLNSKEGEREVGDFYSTAHLMTYEEVQNYFKDYIDTDIIEEMKANTLNILEGIESYELTGETKIPEIDTKAELEKFPKIEFDLKEYENINKYLNSTNISDTLYINGILKGLKEKIGEFKKEYLERIDLELGHVWDISENIQQPLSSYFNTMVKMIEIIWEEGDSLVGVSRGSAASYLTNFLLGITQLDPLNNFVDLPEWRFLHRERAEFPDIDIDTEGSKRLQVIDSVRQYMKSIGGDLVQVATFGTFGPKAAIKTAAKGLNIPDSDANYLCGLIPSERGSDWSLQDCMHGNPEEGRAAMPAFKKEMNKHKDFWKVASRIANLVTNLSIHAAGVVAINDKLENFTSLLKTVKGTPVSAYDLGDCEAAGMIKYDFLTVNALDKIRLTLNFLLEDKEIEWQGSLQSTYEKYLSPQNLDYDNPEMWEKVCNGEIMSLFQFDTFEGGKVIRSLKPKSIVELASANSLMRLQATDDGVMPLDKYNANKEDIETWEQEMTNYALTEEEKQVLRDILTPFYGVADTQELVMQFVLHPKIGGGTVTLAHKLRKGLAKKKDDVIAAAKKAFYESGEANGTRKQLLNYIWNEQIQLSLGYSFSIIHVAGYTAIALQEMNLATRYDPIYWNTANLCSDVSAFNSSDFPEGLKAGYIKPIVEHNKKGVKKQYGKIASAITRIRNRGVAIELPDINSARFGFVPNVEKGSIFFGLQGLNKIGESLIQEIMNNRPYSSFLDFLTKMNALPGQVGTKIQKDRVVSLIKAGAFDALENKPRTEIMANYLNMISGQKQRLTMQNAAKLIELNLLPQELSKEIKIFNFNKYLRRPEFKHAKGKLLSEIAIEFLYECGFSDNNWVETAEGPVLNEKEWKKFYDNAMNSVREYIQNNSEMLLSKVNSSLTEQTGQKYSEGDLASWELDSLGFYHGDHPLAELADTLEIDFSSPSEMPPNELAGYFNIRGKSIPKFKIHTIIGTVLESNKQKRIVYFSTPEGVIDIKVDRANYAKYDKTVTYKDENGNEKEDQSWFTKGTFLVVCGVNRGEYFAPKVYKNTGMPLMTRVEPAGDGYLYYGEKPHEEEDE